MAETPLRTWWIKYTEIPTAYHRPANAVVEAATADDATTLLRHRLGDGNGVHNYVLEAPVPYAPPTVAGRIVKLREDA